MLLNIFNAHENSIKRNGHYIKKTIINFDLEIH